MAHDVSYRNSDQKGRGDSLQHDKARASESVVETDEAEQEAGQQAVDSVGFQIVETGSDDFRIGGESAAEKKAVDRPTAVLRPSIARSGFPAPWFCATKALMACMKARGMSMIKAQTFSATPTPAEAMRPSVLTMASTTRKESPTSRSYSAIGAPKRTIRVRMGVSTRISLREKGKGRVRRLSMRSEMRTLNVWEETVASAAPAAPI